MRRLQLPAWWVALAALPLVAATACNALTGAGDLAFDDGPGTPPADGSAGGDGATGDARPPGSEGGVDAAFDVRFDAPPFDAGCTTTTSVGPRRGTSATETGSGSSWTGLTNALTPGSGEAFSGLTGPNIPTKALVITGFGFNLPSGTKIAGITVRIDRYATLMQITDAVVTLRAVGAPVGASRAETATGWPTALAPRDYGGPDDTWGAGSLLSPVMVNAPSFGVSVSAVYPMTAGGPAVFVDDVQMTLTICD